MRVVLFIFFVSFFQTPVHAYEPGPAPEFCTTCFMQEYTVKEPLGFAVYPWVNNDGFGIIEPGKIFEFSGLSTYVIDEEDVCEPFLIEYLGDLSVFEEQIQELETEIEQDRVLIIFDENWSIAPMSIRELEETLGKNCRFEDLESH